MLAGEATGGAGVDDDDRVGGVGTGGGREPEGRLAWGLGRGLVLGPGVEAVGGLVGEDRGRVREARDEAHYLVPPVGRFARW